jgi:short-subunit dehydrogenase
MYSIFFITGLCIWVYGFLKLMRWIYIRWLSKPTSFEQYRDKWALITGASMGTGKAFALEFASRGLHIILIARSKDLLSQLSLEIQNKYKRKTKVIIANFYDPNCYEMIEKEIEGLEVAVLVNNVGGVVETPFKEYLKFGLDEEENLITLNDTTCRRMTRMILPQMVQRKSGIILNLGSLSSYFCEYIIPYATTKARLIAFTEALDMEYKESGIKVRCAIYGPVNTPKLPNPMNSISIPSPERVAKETLDLFDKMGVAYIPFLLHELQLVAILLLPKFIRHFIMKIVYEKLRTDIDEMKKKE